MTISHQGTNDGKKGPHDPRPDPIPQVPKKPKPGRTPYALAGSTLFPGMQSWHPVETVTRYSTGNISPVAL